MNTTPNPNRKPQIHHALLSTLDQCGDHALPEGTLQEHLSLRVRPAVSDEELRAALAWGVEQGAIKSMEGAFGSDEKRWLITEIGRVKLSQ